MENTMDITARIDGLSSAADTIWVLLAAILIFMMQMGFASVEAGFTRSKNTANILMKNLLDFCFGALLFWLLGFRLMFGADAFAGLLANPFAPGASIPDNIPQTAFLIFQTMFCATTATIVSGAMAERTQFRAYFVYCIFISALVYPLAGHWTWGGGWLAALGFHDFAGSAVVHSVGGWLALVGAASGAGRFGEAHAVVAGIGFGELREFARGGPAEAARVNDHAAQRCAVAAGELRRRVLQHLGRLRHPDREPVTPAAQLPGVSISGRRTARGGSRKGRRTC